MRRVAILASIGVIGAFSAFSVFSLSALGRDKTSVRPQGRVVMKRSVMQAVVRGEAAPYSGVSSTDISGALRIAGRALVVPNSNLASVSCLTNVWVERGEKPDVIERFSTGFVLELSPAYADSDYAAVAEELGPPIASVQMIKGKPALAILANGAGQGNLGSVGFTFDHNSVVVYGMASPSDLLSVAESVQDSASRRPPATCPLGGQ